ncbi:Hypothetical predicted protein [Podarcis lilfordi]|uniref:Uncharacterized protein n=1 Tax=Podarcis lilfordi TaxID=74358 RepID=A0AA35PA10_9SAUR|nr:Hypothetical predicted protein [Podarcis lilfordi]
MFSSLTQDLGCNATSSVGLNDDTNLSIVTLTSKPFLPSEEKECEPSKQLGAFTNKNTAHVVNIGLQDWNA